MVVLLDDGGDVFTPGDPPHGVCIAFDDDALEPTPTWTRLDDPTSTWRLRVAEFQIERGSDSDTDTIKTGTASVTLNDPFGVLDPTNTTSPFWDVGAGETKLNPNLQAAIARWNPVTGTWSTRFRGHIRTIRHVMNVSGFSQVTLELVDLLDMLADLRLSPDNQGDTPRTESVGDIFYHGGSPVPANDDPIHVDDRIKQILTDSGLTSAWWDIFSGNVQDQEVIYERDGQIIQALEDAADSEFPDVSRLFISKDGIVTFRGRFARFFPDHPGYGIGDWDVGGSVEAAADANVVLLSDFQFRRSKDDIVNVATALPKGLEDGDVSGQMVTDSASITKYGWRPWTADNLLTWKGHDEVGDPVSAADETKKFATFKVDNFKDPKTRVEQITVLWRHPDSFSGPAAWEFLNGVELGDLVRITTTHRGGGGFDEDYYVEAIREHDEPGPNASIHKVTMQLDVSPRSFYAENPFGELDMGDS